MLYKKETNEKGDTWCTILIDNIKTKVKVRHIGKGKFKIVNDEINGNLIGSLLDASDIFHC